jgi:L-alanine-DL-glutamate epimerase-like enolase superfamily enzyme
MKVTGFRSLTTVHDWGRRIGDVNGVFAGDLTAVPVLIVQTDEGLEGVGLGAHAEIDRLFPAVEGEDPRSVAALYDRMLAYAFKAGHAGSTYGTIGALDTALWDLKAKAAGEPLWRLLGGRDRFVPGYASGLDAGLDDAGLERFYAPFAARGFTGAKVKGGADAARDLPRLRLVSEVLAAGAGRPPWLAPDVNETWNRGQAARYLHRLEAELDLAWIEEPLRRWDAEGHATLRTTVRTPIATGENLTGVEQFMPLLRAGAVDIVQPGCVWGITHLLRVAHVAHAYDLVVSPVGYTANPVAAAATAIPNHLVLEVQDLTVPAGLDIDQEFADGGVVLGDRPGLGITVDEAAMRAPAGPVTPAPAGPHVRPARAGRRISVEGDPTP